MLIMLLLLLTALLSWPVGPWVEAARRGQNECEWPGVKCEHCDDPASHTGCDYGSGEVIG